MRREGFELANCQRTLVVGQRKDGGFQKEGGDFMSSLDNHSFCLLSLGLALGHIHRLSLTNPTL